MAFAKEVCYVILNRRLNADSFMSMWPSFLCKKPSFPEARCPQLPIGSLSDNAAFLVWMAA